MVAALVSVSSDNGRELGKEVRRFRQASARFAQTERDARRIWSLSAYRSTAGKSRVHVNTRIAESAKVATPENVVTWVEVPPSAAPPGFTVTATSSDARIDTT